VRLLTRFPSSSLRPRKYIVRARAIILERVHGERLLLNTSRSALATLRVFRRPRNGKCLLVRDSMLCCYDLGPGLLCMRWGNQQHPNCRCPVALTDPATWRKKILHEDDMSCNQTRTTGEVSDVTSGRTCPEDSSVQRVLSALLRDGIGYSTGGKFQRNRS